MRPHFETPIDAAKYAFENGERDTALRIVIDYLASAFPSPSPVEPTAERKGRGNGVDCARCGVELRGHSELRSGLCDRCRGEGADPECAACHGSGLAPSKGTGQSPEDPADETAQERSGRRAEVVVNAWLRTCQEHTEELTLTDAQELELIESIEHELIVCDERARDIGAASRDADVLKYKAANDLLRPEAVELRRKLAEAESRAAEYCDKYHDLLMTVGNAFPGETRHETAKRYIYERENQNNPPAAAATEPSAEGAK